ncbi:MAG: hypothetical protein ACQESF_06980, partial [Nanobdellota archaeon]
MFKQIFNKVSSFAENVIENLENSKAPMLYFFLTFVFSVTLRTFIEFISDNTRLSIVCFMHYFFSFVAIACFVLLLFYLLTRKPVIKLIKIVLPAFFVLIVAPIFDLLISKGKGYNIGYIDPEVHGNLLMRFFTFAGSFSGSGVTPGMKFEIMLALIGIFIYLYLATRNIWKGLLGAFGFYVILFVFAIFPYLLRKGLSFLNLSVRYSDILMSGAYLLIIFVMSTVLVYIANKTLFKKIISEFSWLRLAHFEFMFVGGVLLGIKESSVYIHSGNVLDFALIPLSIFFACVYSLITNNLEDYGIDKI